MSALHVMPLGPTLRGAEEEANRRVSALAGYKPDSSGALIREPRTYVYIVQEEGGGFVKIGRTTDLSARIRALEANSPRSLVIRAVLRETDDLERELLYRFVWFKARGEWFHPHESLCDFADEHYDYELVLEALSEDTRESWIWP